VPISIKSLPVVYKTVSPPQDIHDEVVSDSVREGIVNILYSLTPTRDVYKMTRVFIGCIWNNLCQSDDSCSLCLLLDGGVYYCVQDTA
jgi:hypothetical protein